MGVATDEAGRFLALNKVGVLRVGTAGHREAEGLTIGCAAGRRATSSIALNSVSRQRFIAGGGSELDDRLETKAVGNVSNNFMCNIS